MTYTIGIDPGTSGAIALYDGDSCVKVWDMPLTNKTTGKGQEVNPYLLADIISEAKEVAGQDGIRANVEQVTAMPGQGVTSMFGFGDSFGVVRGVLAAHGIPIFRIKPQAWKKKAGLIGKEKDASRGVAIERFPELAGYLSRKKDNGRSDAMLIAAHA